MRQANKKPLYRKVNTTAHGVGHLHGGDYRDSRKRATDPGMRQGMQRGLDDTPLFRFLISKVGSSWPAVHSEAVARLDREEPLYWLVSRRGESTEAVVRVGENSYFSGLFVDDDGVLRVVNPNIDENTLTPSCRCCTHTFNGKPFTRRYRE